MMQRLFLACLVVGFGSLARAQFFTGPEASGAGGAGRAAVDSAEAGLLNPASVAHIRGYNFAGSYGYGHHEREGDFNQFSFLVADGTADNLFPAAFSYVQRSLSPVNGVSDKQTDIQLAGAFHLLQDVTIGVAAHRQTDNLGSGAAYEQYNGHVGLLYTPTDYFGLGLVGYDLAPASASVPVGIQGVPTFGIGSNLIIMNTLHLRLDLVRPDKWNPNRRTNVLAGLETYFRDDFLLRTGVLCNEVADETFFTLGLGYKGPRLSFDYTFQKDVRVANSYRHLFDMWLPF